MYCVRAIAQERYSAKWVALSMSCQFWYLWRGALKIHQRHHGTLVSCSVLASLGSFGQQMSNFGFFEGHETIVGCQVSIRDVNLPLFGGIPLFIFTFRFFQNYFPLFLKNCTKKKKKKKKSLPRTIASVRIASVNSR